MIRFSVVTVVRNDCAGALRTLQSVFAQSWPRYEVIVQDGASTDGTSDMLRRLAGFIDSLEIAPDAGIYDAMNRALARATGDYVLFLNAGDWFENDTVLEKVAGAIRPHDDIFVGQAIRAEDGKPHPYRPRNQFWLGSINDHQASFVRRALMQSLRFDTAHRIAGDLDFFTRARAIGARDRFEPIPVARKPFSVGASSGFTDRVRDRLPLLEAAWGADYPVRATIEAEVRAHAARVHDIDPAALAGWGLGELLDRIALWEKRLG